MRPDISAFLRESYDAYPRIESAFQAALDESLQPRGPEMLYDMLSNLRLPPGASVLDLGCGEGRQSVRLARDFGFAVHGIDPIARHIELAGEELGRAAIQNPELSELVRFEDGMAEAIPAGDSSVDLIWCKDVLVHVEALEQAFAECHRVLRRGGRMLVYHSVLGTDRLELREAAWKFAATGIVQPNTNPQHFEGCFAAAGFEAEECIELTSEWGEYEDERTGEGSRRLIHTARLLRAPERYIAQFGQTAYDIMLGDCLWHVYRMIGKMGPRVYLLKLSGAN